MSGSRARELPSPALVFAVVATALGLALIAAVPPFRWGDENTHYLRAVRLAGGNWAPGCGGGDVKVAAPLGAVQLVLRFSFPPPGEATPSWHGLAEARRIELQPTAPYPISIVRSPYSPLPYAAQAAGAVAARAGSTSALVTLYAARLGNLLVWVWLVCLALRIAPGMRWPLCALALSPMATFVAATCSVDPTTTGTAFLWTAYVLHLAATPGEGLRRGETAALCALATSLALGKSVYAGLIPLVWIAPPRRLGGPVRAIGLTALLLAIAGAAAAAWSWISGPGCTSGLATVDAATVEAHLRALRTDPASVLSLVGLTADVQLRNLIQVLADTKGGLAPQAPSSPWLLGAAIAIGWICDPPLARGVSLWQRAVALATAAAVFSAITVVAFVYWTPAGATTAHGTQIRYLLPLLPALLVAAAPPRLPLPPQGRAAAGILVAALCAVVLAQTAQRGFALFAP